MIFSPKIVFATETFSPQACVFAFSTTDRASLLAIRKWRKKVKIPFFFVSFGSSWCLSRILLVSFEWHKVELFTFQVEDECGDIPMVLVQNKIDLISQSEIDQ